MSIFSFRQAFSIWLVFAFFLAAVQAQESKGELTAPQKDKPPIIIIPGLTGTELVNKKTNEVVWFKINRSKDDDLRLPISPVLRQNRDNLVPKDIIRKVQFIKFLPETEIYERLINALEKRGGYKEGSLDSPPKDGFQNTFYVFPYDWRLDNVENARLLVRKIEALKLKLRKPNLKFNVVGHSMGGLIARYAAMYGNADLPAGKPRPTWAGGKHFDKIFLLGTPNEGSIRAFNALLEGFSYIGGGLNLPFIQNISKFDVFTIPSMYQLLPQGRAFLVYDENFKPMEIDLFDPKNWDAYDWSIYQDEAFTKKFSPAEQKQAKAYFHAVLSRAKRFQTALNAGSNVKIPVSFYLVGADCKETKNAILVIRDTKKNRWKTISGEDSFERSNGEKVTKEEVKKLLYAMGDGVVTKSSLKLETNGNSNILPVKSELFLCEGHNKLVTNPDIQSKLFNLLNIEVLAETAAAQ